MRYISCTLAARKMFTLLKPLIVAAALVCSSAALGPDPVNLRSAGDFAILAKTGVSSVPPSVVTGNVGVSPIKQSAITGFSLLTGGAPAVQKTDAKSDQVTGKLYAADNMVPTPRTLTTAVSDMQTAYVDAAGRVGPNHVNYNSNELAGTILSPGLYKFDGNVLMSGDCTISGSATDTWIFQIAGTMNVNAGAGIVLAGGALAKNIVWVVADSVTFAAGARFEGIVLGMTSATFVTGSSINGRVLMQTAVVLGKATVNSAGL